jgi:amino acid permease
MFLVAYSGFMSGAGLYLLSLAAKQVGHRSTSFFSVSQITYPQASLYVDLAIAIKCFGVSISYLIIIGDLMPQVLAYFSVPEASIFMSRKTWITLFMTCIIPLSFLKKLDSLRYTSSVALGSVFYVLMVVIFNMFNTSIEFPDWSEIRFLHFDMNFFSILPVFVFGFTCHQNIFSIFNELQDNSQTKINSVIKGSIFNGLAVYQAIGALGYITFGNHVKSNILSMYQNSPIITFGRLAVVFLVLFSYPLQVHPCRACVLKIVSGYKAFFGSYAPVGDGDVENNSQPSQQISPATDDSHMLFNIITICIIFFGYLISISVSQLDLVLSFVGSTGSTAISFILPGIFYLKISSQTQTQSKWTTILAKYLVVYGFLVMIFCLTFNFRKLLVY